jgi:transcriptional antiterminator NusG
MMMENFSAIKNASLKKELPPQWYVLYVRSRAEKKVKERLDKLQMESFLPLIKIVRQWSDRKKNVQVPLFGGYIFLYTMPSEFVKVKMIEGVVGFVKQGKDIATIKSWQVEAIKKFLETGYPVETMPDDLQPGSKVRINFGPLKDIEGEITEIRNERHFIVRLEVINQVLIISLPASYLEKLN